LLAVIPEATAGKGTMDVLTEALAYCGDVARS
jgi:hypothetical protein